MFSEDMARAIVAERTQKSTMRVDGTVLTVRPIEITDVDRLARMTERLSPRSIYFRFFAPIKRLPWSALLWLANVDHCRRDALVALDGDEIVAVARYDQLRDSDAAEMLDAELAVTVEDRWQHRGVGRELAHRLSVLARERGCDAFTVTVLPDNRPALDLIHQLAPDAGVRFRDGTYVARLPLRPADAQLEPARGAGGATTTRLDTQHRASRRGPPDRLSGSPTTGSTAGSSGAVVSPAPWSTGSEPGNVRSRAVMERLGMGDPREITHRDRAFVLHSIRRPPGAPADRART